MQKEKDWPGFYSILNSLQKSSVEECLFDWESQVRNGHIKRVLDQQTQLPVFELLSLNNTTTFLKLPKQKEQSLHIKYPILVMLIKNLERYFSFEITIRDKKKVKKQFRCTNFQSVTRLKPNSCSMPVKLDKGWNQIRINLGEYCKKAFDCEYSELQGIKIYSNCRIARVYFNERQLEQEQIPVDYKLFVRVEPFIP